MRTVCTLKICEEICLRLSGGESLSSICVDKNMPGKATVIDWVTKDYQIPDAPDGVTFAPMYYKAREAAGVAHGHRVAELAEDVVSGKLDHKRAGTAMKGFMWAAERMAPRVHTSTVDHVSSDKSMSPVASILQSVDGSASIIKKKEDE